MDTQLNNIRNILIIITTVGVIIGIFGKVISGYFIESIKYKYKYVPEQQSTFEIITTIISAIIFALEVIAIVGIIIFIVIQGKDTDILIYNKVNLNIEYIILGMFIIWTSPLIITIYMFNKLKTLFIEKLNNKMKVSSLKIDKNIIISSILFSAIDLSLNSGLIFIVKSVGNDVQNNVILSILILACFTNIIILMSLINVISELNLDVNYTFHMHKEEISCKCYLEYSEYYLVIEDGVQNFIKKSEIEKIEKTVKRKRREKTSIINSINLEGKNSAS